MDSPGYLASRTRLHLVEGTAKKMNQLIGLEHTDFMQLLSLWYSHIPGQLQRVPSDLRLCRHPSGHKEMPTKIKHWTYHDLQGLRPRLGIFHLDGRHPLLHGLVYLPDEPRRMKVEQIYIHSGGALYIRPAISSGNNPITGVPH